MRVSELREKLEQLEAEYGNLHVAFLDYDYGLVPVVAVESTVADGDMDESSCIAAGINVDDKVIMLSAGNR